MTNPENKRQWQEEAQQLKRDLDNRKKIVQKREIEIKFGGVASSKKAPPRNTQVAQNPNDQDALFRRQLGL